MINVVIHVWSISMWFVSLLFPWLLCFKSFSKDWLIFFFSVGERRRERQERRGIHDWKEWKGKQRENGRRGTRLWIVRESRSSSSRTGLLLWPNAAFYLLKALHGLIGLRRYTRGLFVYWGHEVGQRVRSVVSRQEILLQGQLSHSIQLRFDLRCMSRR